jgi:hypothetical protein
MGVLLNPFMVQASGGGVATVPDAPVLTYLGITDTTWATSTTWGTVTTGGSAILHYSVTVPTSDGGSPITGYTFYADAIPAVVCTSGAFDIDVTGITRTQLANANVVVRNSVGSTRSNICNPFVGSSYTPEYRSSWFASPDKLISALPQPSRGANYFGLPTYFTVYAADRVTVVAGPTLLGGGGSAPGSQTYTLTPAHWGDPYYFVWTDELGSTSFTNPSAQFNEHAPAAPVLTLYGTYPDKTYTVSISDFGDCGLGGHFYFKKTNQSYSFSTDRTVLSGGPFFPGIPGLFYCCFTNALPGPWSNVVSNT